MGWLTDLLAKRSPIQSYGGYLAAAITLVAAMVVDSYLLWPFVVFVGALVTYTVEIWATARRNKVRVSYIDDEHIDDGDVS